MAIINLSLKRKFYQRNSEDAANCDRSRNKPFFQTSGKFDQNLSLKRKFYQRNQFEILRGKKPLLKKP
jgi:hypothetical protein